MVQSQVKHHSFNVIMIMTTNAGARELQAGGIGFIRQPGVGAGESQAVKEMFSPEFRNRLDAIISFQPLGEPMILSIVDKFVGQVIRMLAKRKVLLEVVLQARRFLARKGYDPAYGARPLGRTIEEHIKKPLADELLFGKLAHGGLVLVTLEQAGTDNERLAFKFNDEAKRLLMPPQPVLVSAE